MSVKMSAEKELEEQLLEVGNKLLEHPSSTDELLPLLDQVEYFLSRVEQSPPKSMQAALSPLTKALATDELLRHANADVKVAIASCISEITRITAPDAPYDDDKMKEVFQLIVSSFEDLSDVSSRSFNKRAQILDTVAKVRSCVVMLDLECDVLIAEMFQIFLATIREHHPESIFSSMETIMKLVILDCEDIPSEILFPLLACLEKDNQEAQPKAVQLAEKIIGSCSSKLKPYLSQVIRSLGSSLGDYRSVIAAVCQNGSGNYMAPNTPTNQSVLGENSARVSTEDDQTNQAEGSKPASSASDETVQLAIDQKEVSPEDVDPDMKESPKIDNGTINTGNGKQGSGRSTETSIGAETHIQGDRSSTDKLVSKVEISDSESRKPIKLGFKLENTTKKRGSKPNSLVNISESSDASHNGDEKEAQDLPDVQDSHERDAHGSPMEETAVEAVRSLQKEPGTNLSSPKAAEDGVVDVASPSFTVSKKGVRSRKKERSILEEIHSVEPPSKRAAEETNDSKVKPHGPGGKKLHADLSNEDLISADVKTSKNDDGTSDSETKQMKELDKKEDESFNADNGLSSKKNKDGKKCGRGKAHSENELAKSSAKDEAKISLPKSPTKSAKDEGSQEETPRTSAKRKRVVVSDKVSETVEYGENLVGAKIEVWWPKDRQYYEGRIHSFDSNKKKHKVLYTDGDEETLNLRKEQWKFVHEDSVSSEEQADEREAPDTTSAMLKRKKGKATPESLATHGKVEASPKSGTPPSAKSKGTVNRSNRKSKDDSKGESKLIKEKTSKPGGKYEDDSGGRSKAHHLTTSGKSGDDFSKTSIKTKDADSTMSKSKSKQETAKVSSKSKQGKSKGKTSQGGGSSNGMGKAKYGSSKAKEAGDSKEKSKERVTKLAKAPEEVKGKAHELQVQEATGTASQKKRRRGLTG